MQYINPTLELDGIRAAMATQGRVLIRDFFVPEVAEALARAVDQIDWDLSFRDEHGDRHLTGEELRRLTPRDRASLAEGIHRVAAQRFQFSFLSYSMVDSAERGETDLLTRFVRWMAGDDFLSIMRQISGLEDINRVFAQATMYSRGSFLLAHDDHVDAERRRLAYVINLTRQWRPEWGGMLHFLDAQGNVVDTFFPHFNSMSLFAVPQSHFVSYVPPFAQGERQAITGWLIAA